MKHISRKAAAVLDMLTAGLEKPGDHRKFDNAPGAFMALSVELISTRPWQVSLCHYGEQNGDLMRDPEMIFYRSAGNYYPTYYRNDYVGAERFCVKFERDGEGFKVRYNSAEMRDQASFAELWMQNIVEQQGLEAGKITSER